MRVLPFLLAVAVLWLPAAAQAQRSPVVLELFTSQGCSSCPPADALLARLALEPGVIPLALHVDYWDYLGWADSFGNPAFTKRQRGYAKMSRQRSVFTPQMIIQGHDIEIGHDAKAILSRIADHQRTPPSVTLRIARESGVLRINLAPAGVAVGPADVQVVRYLVEKPVSIEAGENAGHRVVYTHIVTDWQTIAQWDGRDEAKFDVEGMGYDPLAVIVQRQRFGPVLAAAKLD